MRVFALLVILCAAVRPSTGLLHIRGTVDNLPPPAVVEHAKKRGSGYERGSPLYEAQQTATTTSAPTTTSNEPDAWMSTLGPAALRDRYVEDVEGRTCEKPIPPVSPSIQCVVVLVIAYFAVYTLLAIARSVKSWTGNTGLLRVVQCVGTTIEVAPMLAILFLACRMRAIQLAQGNPAKYDLPPAWVGWAMWAATWALVAQVVAVLLCSIISGRAPESRELAADPRQYFPDGGETGAMLSAVRFVGLLTMYGATVAILIGICTMQPPVEVWGEGKRMPVSPAVDCTMALLILFFAINGGKQLFDLLLPRKILPGGPSPSSIREGLQHSAHAVAIAPMFCILFITARVRALRRDPVAGNPQAWAQWLFYACTVTIFVHALLALLACMLAKGQAVKSVAGDVRIQFGTSPAAAATAKIMQLFLVLAIYGGAAGIVFSILVIGRDPKTGALYPMSTATTCVVILVIQYFFVYLGLMTALTVRMLLATSLQEQGSPVIEATITTFKAALGTVSMAPMIAVLLLALRIRTSQITLNTGDPPTLVQDAMYAAVVALLIQLGLILLTPCVATPPKPPGEAEPNASVTANEDGSLNVTPPDGVAWIAVLFDIVRYAFLLFLYGSLTLLIAAIFFMDCNQPTGWAPLE